MMTPAAAATGLRELLWSLEVDPADIRPTRVADPEFQSDQAESARQIRELAESLGEDAGALVGTEDDSLRSQNHFPPHLRGPHFEHYAEHEAAHAAAAHSLGWQVKWVDAYRGQTQIQPPDFQSYSLRDRNLMYAVIAASGAVFTGASTDRAELASDRLAVRLRGYTKWEEARSKAELLKKDPYIKALYRRIVDALLVAGRLEGPALDRVLAG